MEGELRLFLRAFNPTIVGFFFAINLFILLCDPVFYGGKRNEYPLNHALRFFDSVDQWLIAILRLRDH